MIKTLTAFTEEIDDVDLAVDEIMGQLELKKNLLKNSVGFLTCYAEFVESGVVKALSEKLPFDVIGATTIATGTNGRIGNLVLNLMVLSADDVSFAAGVSGSLATEQKEPIAALCSQLSGQLSEDPIFMISFMPLIFNVGGPVFIECLNEATDNLPVFGTLAVDHTSDYSKAETIFNGNTYKDCMTLVYIGGNIKPKFMVESLSEDRVFKQKAVITDAADNLLKEVNGIPVVEYMESLGLTRDGVIEGQTSTPFIVDVGDGTKPVIRAIFAQTPEGYAVCGGPMPVNATLAIGSIDYDDVMETSARIAQSIKAEQEPDGVLLFSCVGRNYALGINSADEMQQTQERIGAQIPYQLSYSGGEVCPLMDSEGVWKNSFHNDTIVACVF